MLPGLRGRILEGEVQDQYQTDIPPVVPIVTHFRIHIQCGCGKPLTASWSKGRKQKYGYYRCPGCPKINIKKADLERQFLELLDQLQPQPDYLRLFKEVVLDLWQTRMSQSVELRKALDQKVEAIRAKRERLLEAYVYDRRVDSTTYTDLFEKLGEALALAEMEAHDAKLDELDVEGIVGFAEHLALNAARLWTEATPDQRPRLQGLLFPKGLTYASGAFGTAATYLLFSGTGELQVVGSTVAGPEGLEWNPVLLWLREVELLRTHLVSMDNPLVVDS